ncbi:MAG: hypothetical protein AB1458_15445 [Bacteroidota bacterium]
MKKVFFSLATLLSLALWSFTSSSSAGLVSETLKGKSGNEYLIVYKGDAAIDFEITRPDKNDQSILLCIAGAFTTLDDYAIDGIYVCKGKIGNLEKPNTSLGGAILMTDGECTIFPSNKGALLTDSLLQAVAAKKGSLFQQIQMIEKGKAAKFKDVKLFQRRGIAVFTDGRIAIAESKKAITLKTFADDLAALDVKDLLYTDMGSWDEGWYRNSGGKQVALGTNHSQTSKQSNWIVFRK